MGQPSHQPASPPRHPAALALGLCAGLGQVVLLRELMVLCGGSELALALGLAAWLAWSALGSLLGAKLATRKTTRHHAAPALWAAAAGCLASLALARLAPLPGGAVGGVPSLGQSLAAALVVLAPAGTACGAAFPWLLAAAPRAESPSRTLSAFYGLEALGAALAGLAFALWLAPRLNPLAVLLCGALAAALAAARAPTRPSRWLAVGLLGLGLIASPGLDRDLRRIQWRGYHLAGLAESPYAQLVACRRGGQYDFFASGLWLFSRPAPLTVQRQGLFPLLAHPAPRTALFIGGGADAEGPAAAAARQEAARGLKQVTVVELDPWLAAFLGRLRPRGLPPNLRLVSGDGRAFLQTTPRRYDLVVLLLPPPVTLGLSRYYSLTGFRALSRALAPGGVGVVRLPGMECLAGRLQAARLATLLAAAQRVFPVVRLVSGRELWLLLCQEEGTLPAGPEAWIARLEARRWQGVTALRPDTLAQAADPMRLAFLQAVLARAGPQPPNRDLLPRALLLAPELWGAELAGASSWAWGLARLRPRHILWPAALGVLVCLLWARRRPAAALPLGVAVTGLTAMALSVLVLLAYQVLFGAVYLGLALVSAGFMTGMSAAAWLLAGRWASVIRPRRWLLGLGLGLAGACLLLWGLTAAWHGAAPGPAGRLGLLGLAAVCGGLTGAYFGLAGRVRLEAGGVAPAAAGGRLYGLDLAGGVAGALLPVLLLPAVGFGACLAGLALLNLWPAAAWWAGGRAVR